MKLDLWRNLQKIGCAFGKDQNQASLALHVGHVIG